MEHLVDCEHKISPDLAFRVIYRTSANVPKAVRIRHLAIVEAIAIHYHTCHSKFYPQLLFPIPPSSILLLLNLHVFMLFLCILWNIL